MIVEVHQEKNAAGANNDFELQLSKSLDDIAKELKHVKKISVNGSRFIRLQGLSNQMIMLCRILTPFANLNLYLSSLYARYWVVKDEVNAEIDISLLKEME